MRRDSPSAWMPAGGLAVPALLALTCLVVPRPARPQAAAPAFQLPPWKEVQLTAHKAVFTARATLTADMSQATGALPAPDGIPDLVPPGPLVVLHCDTQFSGTTVTTTWMDASTGACLQVDEVKGDERRRVRRLTDTGAVWWSIKPANRSERKQPPDRWTQRGSGGVQWDASKVSGALASDSLALLLLACSPELAPRDARLTTYTISHGKLMKIDLTRAGDEHVESHAPVRGPAGIKSYDGQVAARHVVLSVDTSDDDDENSANVGLFGMDGKVDVFVAEDTGAPLELRGHVPKLGQVEAHLVRCELR